MEIEVLVSADEQPPLGSPAVIEIRDTRLQDAASVTIDRVEVATGPRDDDGSIARGALQIPGPAPDLTVWVHIDHDGSGRVGAGDWITMEAVVVVGPGPVRAPVKRIPPTSPPPRE